MLYVDDIILTGNNILLFNKFVCHLGHSFAIKDMGYLQFFLGIDMQLTDYGLFFSQTKYALGVLQRAHMHDSNVVSTPMAVHSTSSDDTAFHDPHLYRSLASAPQ